MLEEVSLLLSQARGAYQKEQYETALGFFRRACQVDPHSPEALLGIGEVGAYLQLHDESTRAFLTLADIYTQAGMLEVAAEVIERVLELAPDDPLALRFRRFLGDRLRRTTDEHASLEDGPTISDEKRAATQRLSEQPSESSLDELVPWTDTEDSRVQEQTTGVVNEQLDALLGELASADVGPSESTRERLSFADTVVSSAEQTDVSSAEQTEAGAVAVAPEPIESVVIDDDQFADVATRSVPEALIEQLADASRGGDDPFAAETTIGETSSIAARLADETTNVDPPLETARGSGHHHVGGWEFDTTAAVMEENIRVKPRMRLEDVEWDENDFPRFDEAKRNAEVITRTIALEGEGAVAAIASLMHVSPLLAQLDIDGCQELLEGSIVTQCFADQVVVQEGTSGSSFFLLATGQAAVEREIGGNSARRLATISAGNFFGEGSLLADAPRSSTVRVLDDSLLLEIDRALVQRLVARNPRVLTVLTRFLRSRLLSSLMMDSPLFHRIPLEERTDLAPLIHLHKLAPGQVVARRGQVLTGFCTVMAGELKRFDVAQGTGQQVLANLVPGSAFGSRSLYGEPSAVSISAETGCWLLRLPTSDLRELVERHPELLSALGEAETA